MKIVQSRMKSSKIHSFLNVENLVVGQYMVFDIYIKKEDNYIIIIEKGTLLTESLYSKLLKQEKLFIKKSDENNQVLSCDNLKIYVKNTWKDLKKTLEYINTINDEIFSNFMESSEDLIDIDCVRSLIESLIFLIAKEEQGLKRLIPEFIHKDELKYHSLHVAIYSITIASRARMEPNKLVKLGIAALLHDIGKKKVSESIINKNEELTIAELETIHLHPQYSVELLRKNNIHDPYIVDAVLHHHESCDGTGYPNRLVQNKINDFALIISVADVFDALTSTRVTRDAYKSFDALSMMMKDEMMANKFDLKYLQYFLKSL